jgi:hypothetical protein
VILQIQTNHSTSGGFDSPNNRVMAKKMNFLFGMSKGSEFSDKANRSFQLTADSEYQNHSATDQVLRELVR